MVRKITQGGHGNRCRDNCNEVLRREELNATLNAAWQVGIYSEKTGWETVSGRLLRRYIDGERGFWLN